MARTRVAVAGIRRDGKQPAKHIRATQGLKGLKSKSVKKDTQSKEERIVENRKASEKTIDTSVKKKFRHKQAFLTKQRFENVLRKGQSKPLYNYSSRVRQCGASLHKLYESKEIRDTLRITRRAIELAHVLVEKDLKNIFDDASSILHLENKHTLNDKLYVNRLHQFVCQRDRTMLSEIHALIANAST